MPSSVALELEVSDYYSSHRPYCVTALNNQRYAGRKFVCSYAKAIVFVVEFKQKDAYLLFT